MGCLVAPGMGCVFVILGIGCVANMSTVDVFSILAIGCVFGDIGTGLLIVVVGRVCIVVGMVIGCVVADAGVSGVVAGME